MHVYKIKLFTTDYFVIRIDMSAELIVAFRQVLIFFAGLTVRVFLVSLFNYG